MSRFKGIKYLKYINNVNPSYEFTYGELYPLLAVESDTSILTLNNLKNETFIEDDQIGDFAVLTDAEEKADRLNRKGRINQLEANIYVPPTPMSKVNVEVPSNQFQIKVDLDESDFPYWANFIIINGQGVFAQVNEDGTGMKEKVDLKTPIVINIPKKQKPFEILATMFKEGKITYDELEAEIKSVFK